MKKRPHRVPPGARSSPSPRRFLLASPKPPPTSSPTLPNPTLVSVDLRRTSNPSVDNGTFDPGIIPIEDPSISTAAPGANGTLTQTHHLNGFAPTFRTDRPRTSLSFNASFEEQSPDQGTSDAAASSSPSSSKAPSHPNLLQRRSHCHWRLGFPSPRRRPQWVLNPDPVSNVLQSPLRQRSRRLHR